MSAVYNLDEKRLWATTTRRCVNERKLRGLSETPCAQTGLTRTYLRQDDGLF